MNNFDGKLKYIKPLDALRCIGFLGVLFYHLLPEFVPLGYLGVVIFFVLSGFLTMYNYLQYDENCDISSGIKKIKNKICKNYPLLILTILIVSITMIIFFKNFIEQFPLDLISSLLSFNNIYQILANKSYFQIMNSLDPLKHMWALSIEFQFYIVFFLFVFPFYKKNNNKKVYNILFICILVLSYIGNIFLLNLNVDLSRIYYGFDTRISNFLVGMIAAILIKKLENDIKSINLFKIRYIEIIFILMIIFSMFLNIKNNFDVIFYINFYSIMIALLIIILYYHFEIANENNDIILNTISNERISFLSKRSYVIYLVHYPVIVFFNKFTAHINVNIFVYIFSIIFITAFMSELLYRLNCIQLGYKKKNVIIIIFFFLSVISVFISNSINLGILEVDEHIKLQNKELENAINENYLNNDMESKKYIIDTDMVETFKALRNKDLISTNSLIGSEIHYNDGIIEEYSYNTSTMSNVTESDKLKEKKLIDATLKRIKKVNINIGGVATLFEDEYVNNRNVKVTIIGDSITGCAANLLKLYFPNIIIDQVGNRQLKDAPNVYEKLKLQDKLGDFVIISLGTNSTYDIDTDSLQKVYDSLDGRIMILPTIVLPYRVEVTRNKALRDFADKHEYCYIAEWNEAVKTHTECFMSDSIHPTGLGNDVFAQVMFKAIVRALNKQ